MDALILPMLLLAVAGVALTAVVARDHMSGGDQ